MLAAFGLLLILACSGGDETETGVGYRFIVEQLQQANAGTATPSQSTALSG